MRKIKELKSGIEDKIWEVNDQMDSYCRAEFVSKVAQDEGVTMSEAFALCETDPKYSLGMKMCSPSIMLWIRKKEGSEKFKKMLNPDELKIYEEEVEPMNLKDLIKAEMKSQKKAKKCHGKA